MNTITKEQRIKAIEDSIKHWEEDIVKPLQEGRTIDEAYFWSSTSIVAPIGGDSCPLCKIYYYGKEGCCVCPLESCSYDSTWDIFATNPCLKTAQAMVYELRAILIIEDAKDE